MMGSIDGGYHNVVEVAVEDRCGRLSLVGNTADGGGFVEANIRRFPSDRTRTSTSWLLIGRMEL